MSLSNFNLIDDPWIPVRWRDGRQTNVSLQDAFGSGKEIADLACAPHERVSLIRLLVCISQAALGAPPDPLGWTNWGSEIATAVPDYLSRWRSHFNLFGTDLRFIQIVVPANGDPVPTSKLIPHLATGNNPTVFDHLGGSSRSLAPESLALALLSFQMFYPLYGAGYKGKGPCVDGNMIHAILQGEHLEKTIQLNSLDETTIRAHFPFGQMGKPIWELDETDATHVEIATQSYLGRLVPRHRNLWLLDNGSGFHLTPIGLSYPTYPSAIEPSATIVVRKKGSEELPFPLSARLDRALWRDLHSLAVTRESSKSLNAAPLVLQSHIEEFADSDLSLWTGALVTDLKAKILDTLESTFTAPSKLFLSTSARTRYENGVEHAESLSKRLYGAVKTYASTLKNELPPTDSAQRHYWNILNQRANTLLDLVRLQGTPTDPMGTFSFGQRHENGKTDPWTQLVRTAVNDAYQKTCPAQTPRQMKAFAAGLRVLAPKAKSKPTSAPTVNES
jgi:CRISPR system Cascade subunit CasA